MKIALTSSNEPCRNLSKDQPLRPTEKDSPYRDIPAMPTADILREINAEDKRVPQIVAAAIPQLEKLVDQGYQTLSSGRKIFYLGAGTSGRLGVVDASELPPTFGAPPEWVEALIAGGDGAIRVAVEKAEDDPLGGWRDLQARSVQPGDLVVGIAASGTTPYVVGALEKAREAAIATGCLVCNEDSPLEKEADIPVVLRTGAEFITGSTRMKAGTAQKLALNMFSTALMVRMGRVEGNRMVDMHLSNAKLIERGTRMVQKETGLAWEAAQELLLAQGSVRQAVRHFKEG